MSVLNNSINHGTTAIVSHGIIETTPRETYGNGPVLFRIGNGGAGATGLIRALAEDYLTTIPSKEYQVSSGSNTNSTMGSIEWICNHSRNTQLALLHGDIDIALTYERNQERLAESEGWSRTIGCVFHDHFCLAGPVDDPAGIFSASILENALRRIEENGKVKFYSRADMSATMWKEQFLWEHYTGLKPWETAQQGGWYNTNQLSPADALIHADEDGAYLITDRSTLLALVRDQKIQQTTVFFEPEEKESVLMNSCYASTRVVESKEGGSAEEDTKEMHVKRFLEYTLSERGQDVVARFGKSAPENKDSPALFARVSDGFSSIKLRGGRPRDGRWIVMRSN